MTTLRSTLVAFLAVVALATSPTANAADPAEELLRYVPEDVHFCLVVRDLRGHSAALAQSPFIEAWQRSPLAKSWVGTKEIEQLKNVQKYLEGYFQITLDQLRDDILGDAIVVAYRSGPAMKPDQDQGLILLRARDPKKLAGLVDRINQVLRLSGDLKKIEERTIGKQQYFRRVERSGESFYTLRGPVLVFSGQEAMIRDALKLDGDRPADVESPVGKNLRLLGADRALLAMWLNPRAFDADVAALGKQPGGPGPTFAKAFLDCWKNIDGVAFTFSLSKDIELGVTIRGRPEAMPAAVRRFLAEASVRSELWNRFPDDALLAIGTRTGAATLAELVNLFQGRAAFQAVQDELNRGIGAAMGKENVVTEVLPHVGPDWGLCVIAPPKEEKAWIPHIIVAVRVQKPIDRALVTMLRSYAQFAVFGHNRTGKDPLSLKTEAQDPWEIHYLGSKKGAVTGFQPAFGLCDGYLVLASTPQAFRRFVALKPAPAPTNGEVPILRVSFKELRQYVRDRREPLAAFLAGQHGMTEQEVSRQLDGILAGLEFVDRLELTHRSSPGQMTFTLRLRTAHALRK